jgi:hypothetical protein
VKSIFTSQLDTLPAPQQRLWPELRQIPPEYILYGGTAISLRLGHRQSIDFDFFGHRDLDLQALTDAVTFLRDAQTIQRDRNTLTVVVDRDGPIKLSFSGVPRLLRLLPPDVAPENNLQVASLLDLAGTKASVIQVRAEAKDYLDLDALITLAHVDLPHALAAAEAIYGTSFNPQITLKALSYFGDGNLPEVPDIIRERLAAAARAVDLNRLPRLNVSASQ